MLFRSTVPDRSSSRDSDTTVGIKYTGPLLHAASKAMKTLTETCRRWITLRSQREVSPNDTEAVVNQRLLTSMSDQLQSRTSQPAILYMIPSSSAQVGSLLLCDQMERLWRYCQTTIPTLLDAEQAMEHIARCGEDDDYFPTILDFLEIGRAHV